MRRHSTAPGSRGVVPRALLLATAVSAAALVSLPGVSGAHGRAAPAPTGRAQVGATGCSVTVTPPAGPVGTWVTITGDTAGCQNEPTAGGGGFGFIDEGAGVLIGTPPAQGTFSYRFEIPTEMASGNWFAAAMEYQGGGPVGPGEAAFVDTMGPPLQANFDVTWAPPGWDDYTAIMGTTSSCTACTVKSIYMAVRADGYLDAFGPTNPVGNVGSVPLNAPIVASAFTPDGRGYWLVGADGGVFTFGDAGYYGSLGGTRLNAPIVGMAPTADGRGYWLVGADGGVFTFGDAGYFGSLGNTRLNAPIVGIASGPGNGQGYWLVGADGGVFTFGDAGFYGSLGDTRLNAPIVAVARSVDGRGYWLLGADGGVFTFGDAPFLGSAAGSAQQYAMVALAPTPDGQGYWLLGADGGVFTFGDAPFGGSGRSP